MTDPKPRYEDFPTYEEFRQARIGPDVPPPGAALVLAVQPDPKPQPYEPDKLPDDKVPLW